MANTKKVRASSEKLLMQARQRRLRELFDRWDGDQVRIFLSCFALVVIHCLRGGLYFCFCLIAVVASYGMNSFSLVCSPQDGLISVHDIDPHVVEDDTGREVLAMIKDESITALTFTEFCEQVSEKMVPLLS